MTLTFVSVADLRNRLQNPGLDSAVAQSAIDSAVGLVKSVSGQVLEFVRGQVVELAGGSGTLVLPQRPVVVGPSDPLTVSELDMAGNAYPLVEGQSWYRQGDVLHRTWPGAVWPGQWFPTATYPSTRFWPGQAGEVWGPRVRVVFSSGYASDADVPAGLKTVLLGLAEQYAVNPGRLREEQVGGVRLVYASESIRSTRSMIGDLKRDLVALGLRRGGAFSIGG